MVNLNKVRWMTRASIYEKRDGVSDFKRNEYFASDYVRTHILINALCVTVAYILLVGVYAVYKMEELLTMAAELRLDVFLREVVLLYVIVIVIYTAFGVLYYSWQYHAGKKRLRRYYRILRLIEKYGRIEEEDA